MGVLVVDDDAPTRYLVRILLERSHRFFVVAEADSGLAAISAASRIRPDVVVLDWDMPGMTGPEALPLIREIAPDSKIVLFSDRVEDTDPAQTDAFNADLMIAKGRDMSTLVPALLRITKNSGPASSLKRGFGPITSRPKGVVENPTRIFAL